MGTVILVGMRKKKQGPFRPRMVWGRDRENNTREKTGKHGSTPVASSSVCPHQKVPQLFPVVFLRRWSLVWGDVEDHGNRGWREGKEGNKGWYQLLLLLQLPPPPVVVGNKWLVRLIWNFATYGRKGVVWILSHTHPNHDNQQSYNFIDAVVFETVIWRSQTNIWR